MTAFKNSFKQALCIVCHQPGHFNCRKVRRDDFHIPFEEDDIEESDDENLFANYTLKDLKNDERAFRQKVDNDESVEEYDVYDGIGTNIVNSKQMKKIMRNSAHFEFDSARLK